MTAALPSSLPHLPFPCPRPHSTPRPQLYIEAYSRPAANLALLDDIIATRHASAVALGARSYAHLKARAEWLGAPLGWGWVGYVGEEGGLMLSPGVGCNSWQLGVRACVVMSFLSCPAGAMR